MTLTGLYQTNKHQYLKIPLFFLICLSKRIHGWKEKLFQENFAIIQCAIKRDFKIFSSFLIHFFPLPYNFNKTALIKTNLNLSFQATAEFSSIFIIPALTLKKVQILFRTKFCTRENISFLITIIYLEPTRF